MEKEKNVEEGMGSNDQDASSASSVNGESSNNGKKRSRDDEIEVPVPRKKVKIVWTNSLHNRFLQAINHLGLEKAVPKRILEFMNVYGLTRENVASHLQKYRLFLKKVAERGLWTSQATSERILRSSFATGYNPSYVTNKGAALPFPQPPPSTPTFRPGYGGSGNLTPGVGFPRFPAFNHEASTSTAPPPQFPHGQSSLLGGQRQGQGDGSQGQPPLFGYQNNQARLGNGMPIQMQPNNTIFGNTSPRYGNISTSIGNTSPIFGNISPSFGATSPIFGNTSPIYGNTFSSFGNTFPSFSNTFPSFGNTYPYNFQLGNANNVLPPFNPNSTSYAGIRLNGNGELGTGQMPPIRTGLSTNPNLGLSASPNLVLSPFNPNTNWTIPNGISSNYEANQGGVSSSPPTTFSNFLGQAGPSNSSNSTLFGNAANQIPMPFNVPIPNQESVATLGNDFDFSLFNDGSSSDNQLELDEGDLELFLSAINSTTPFFQQQNDIDEEDNNVEINTNDFLNVEFFNSCTLADKDPCNDQGSHKSAEEAGNNANVGRNGNSLASYFPNFNQGAEETRNVNVSGNAGNSLDSYFLSFDQGAEEIRNVNVGGSAGNSLDSHFPSFDETQSSPEAPLDSDLNGIAQATDDNQEWEEDLLDILLANNPY